MQKETRMTTLKNKEPETFITAGYAAVFDNIDAVNDIIKEGAFKGSMKKLIHMPILFSHDVESPIGRIVKAKTDKYGLYIHIELFPEISKAQDIITTIKRGMRVGLSIGYTPLKYFTERKGVTNVRSLTSIKVSEISIVTHPANDLAMIRDEVK